MALNEDRRHGGDRPGRNLKLRTIQENYVNGTLDSLRSANAAVSSGNSSHHWSAFVLESAGIVFVSTWLLEPLLFERQWEELAELCGSDTTTETAWNTLGRTMSEEYPRGLSFDERLYHDIMRLLGPSVCQVTDSLYTLDEIAESE